jgi:predicted RecB family nuclease
LDWLPEQPYIRSRHVLNRICQLCPVSIECLDDALATVGGDDLGIRAGTDPRQRHKLRAKGVEARQTLWLTAGQHRDIEAGLIRR